MLYTLLIEEHVFPTILKSDKRIRRKYIREVYVSKTGIFTVSDLSQGEDGCYLINKSTTPTIDALAMCNKSFY